MTRPDLEQEIAGLQALDTPALRSRWEQALKTTAPKRISRDLMIRSLAYHLQAQAEGGLSKATLKHLDQLAGLKSDDTAPPRPTTPRLKPGTRLVREWNGQVHQVTVQEDGFDYDGRIYRSLSAIARAITGARWSGPRFFDLRS